MIMTESLQDLLRRKQGYLKYEVAIKDIYPTPNNDNDWIGALPLVEPANDVRELNFLESEKMWIKTADGDRVSSLEEALPGGRRAWRLANYYVSADKAAVILDFLPVYVLSNTPTQDADDAPEECAEQLEDDLREMKYAEEDFIDQIMQRYRYRVQLRGQYELFLSNDDGSGEYVRRSHTKGRKMKLTYCEVSTDQKTLGYIMIKSAQTMTQINYM